MDQMIFESDNQNRFFDAGSTSVSVLILGDRIFVANLGDSRVLLRRQNKTIAMTKDMRLSNEEEE